MKAIGFKIEQKFKYDIWYFVFKKYFDDGTVKEQSLSWDLPEGLEINTYYEWNEENCKPLQNVYGFSSNIKLLDL